MRIALGLYFWSRAFGGLVFEFFASVFIGFFFASSALFSSNLAKISSILAPGFVDVVSTFGTMSRGLIGSVLTTLSFSSSVASPLESPFFARLGRVRWPLGDLDFVGLSVDAGDNPLTGGQSSRSGIELSSSELSWSPFLDRPLELGGSGEFRAFGFLPLLFGEFPFGEFTLELPVNYSFTNLMYLALGELPFFAFGSLARVLVGVPFLADLCLFEGGSTWGEWLPLSFSPRLPRTSGITYSALHNFF